MTLTTDGPVSGGQVKIFELGTRYAADLSTVDAAFLTLIELAKTAETPEERVAACELFGNIREMAVQASAAVVQMGDFAEGLEGTAQFSRELRPPLRAIRDGVRSIMDGQTLIEGWVERIDSSGLDCSEFVSSGQ